MKLYQYRGGGYDGCIWEWNFFLFNNGKFYNVYSSGNAGLDTELKAKTYIEEHKDDQHFYEYDLENESSIEEFITENNSTNIGVVCDKVNTYLENSVMFFYCSYCDEKIFPMNNDEYPSYFHDENNYSGDGGIGIQYHSCICEDCYLNRCDDCDSIFMPEEKGIKNQEGHYLCKYCS